MAGNFWREKIGGKKLAGEFRKKMFFIFRFRVVKGDNSVECEIGVESVVRESRQANRRQNSTLKSHV